MTPIHMKSNGVPDRLKETVAPSGKPAPGAAIPAAFENTIRAAESEGTDATTAGADGLAGKHPPGSQRGNIPGGVGSLIAGPGVNVP